MSEQKKSSSSAKITSGIIELVIGLGIYLWVKGHSPNMGFGEMLSNPNNYIIKQPFFNGVLLICAVLVIGGIISIIMGLQDNQKKD